MKHSIHAAKKADAARLRQQYNHAVARARESKTPHEANEWWEAAARVHKKWMKARP